MMRLQKMILIAAAGATFSACKKDQDPIIIIPPSSGAQVQLSGIAGTELGSAAGNSVYLDLSADKQTAILRSGWDLGFYCGADFRVTLNNSTSAGAKVLASNDITTVGAADTIGLILATSQTNPLPEQLVWFDNVAGDLTKTVIPAVSANDADNKVIILNRGNGGGIANRPWIKLRVLRNTNGGYTLQYAGITETTFKTLQVPKDAVYHFKYISFENGIVDAQPEKEKWDLVWSYSVYSTDFGAGLVPYNFSDLIGVNYLSNVQVKQMTYTRPTPVEATAAATQAYNAFNMDSINANFVTTGRWAIGNNWRVTQSSTEPLGARTNRFYVIKDPNGNYYKLKCLSMGVGSDGGTRGKPEFKYSLIK
jgi:hypothetical protein